MATRQALTFALVASTLLTSACGDTGNRSAGTTTAAPAPPTIEAHRAEVDAWRQKHDVDYRRDYVSIAGLHDLRSGLNTAGSAAGNRILLPPSTPPRLGRFTLEGSTVRFEPERGANVLLAGRPVTASVIMRDDSTATPDELTSGDVRLVVHVSGESRAIRVRDPNGPLAKAFVGFSWFDFDPSFRVVGRFIPDAEPRRVRVQNTYGDLDEYATEGVVEFPWQGQMLRLRPFTTRPKRFYFVFRDAAAGQETYEAARFLYADLADDGSVAMDFNVSYNPPCSFNPYTTCPIPLPENRLSVEILAGERAYPVKVPLGPPQ